MASSGYGVEATVESIWSQTWETTQFTNINVMIGTFFNAWIQGAALADTDITDTGVAELLKQATHMIFSYLNSLITANEVSDPWSYAATWINNELGGDKFYWKYRKLIELCQNALYGRIEIVSGRADFDFTT